MAKTLDIKLDTEYNRNYIINGNFDFWQRGTSSTAGSGSGSTSVTFLADRFRWIAAPNGGTAAAYTQSRQSFTLGQTDVPGEPTYFWRINNTTQGSSLGTSSYHFIQQRIEDVRTLAGKKITLSFYAKSTISSKTLLVGLSQTFGTGGSPSSVVLIPAQAITLTSSWQKFTLTFDVPSISGKTLGSNNNSTLDLNIFAQIGSAEATLYSASAVTWQGTGDTDIAQVMINEGVEALPFTLAGKNISGELQACQRYFFVQSALRGTGWARDSDDAFSTNSFNFPVTMRAAPTPTISSLGSYAVHVPDVVVSAPSSLSCAVLDANGFYLYGSLAFTFGSPVRVCDFYGGPTYFDAELN